MKGTLFTDTITIEKVIFKSDDSDFVIADCYSESDDDYFVYTGELPSARKNKTYTVEYEEITHKQYGYQRKIKSLVVKQQIVGVYTYLESGALQGCGPATAQKIYDMFGEDSLRVIMEEPNKLVAIKGISEKRAQQIHDSAVTALPEQTLMSIPGMTALKAKRLHDFYKEKTMDVILNDPYRPVMDRVEGITFRAMDKIVLAAGFAKQDDDSRIAAGLTSVLNDSGFDGHCFSHRKDLLDDAEKLLNVDRTHIEAVLQSEIDKSHVIEEEDNNSDAIYSLYMYDTENTVADYAVSLSKLSSPVPAFVAQRMIDAYLPKDGYELIDEQKQAALGALTNGLFVITGGAGTGKTTIVETIVHVWSSYTHRNVILCAPTGKAARRMEEKVGEKAMTCAKLIADVLYAGRNVPSTNSLIICDEASMLDINTARDLLSIARDSSNRIVFVGDANQLPPIGAGLFFKDLLECPVVPHMKLEVCHRQFGVIAENANKINHGEKFGALTFDNTNTKFVKTGSDDVVDVALKEYQAAVDKFGIKNVCMLLPFRKQRGSIPATETLNELLRKVYNPHKPNWHCAFAAGDRVISMKNDKLLGLANGDIGTVVSSSYDDNEFIVDIDDGDDQTHRVYCTRDKEEDFALAYALTIHKSQGSEYDCVIVVLTASAHIMLERNLLYTAATRGKKKVVLIGEPKAYGIAINTQKASKRNTKLQERIKHQYEVSG